MSKKKSKSARSRAPRGPAKSKARSTLIDALRQRAFPEAVRIEVPIVLSDGWDVSIPTPECDVGPGTASRIPPVPAIDAEALAEVATCLWYLKTKYFKRVWESTDGADEDPRVRRALGRLYKGIDGLRKVGLDVQDPTNRRYQPGSEGTMKPLQFDATPGLNFQRVTETVAPIIYLHEQLIQRGEVFVAVPQDGIRKSPEPSASTEGPATRSDAGATSSGDTAVSATAGEDSPRVHSAEDPRVAAPVSLPPQSDCENTHRRDD